MRIAFVQTYPIYHDHWTTDQWLALENRDRWMPGIAASLGHTVELWGVDRAASVHTSRLEGFGDYTIRLFAASGGGKRTKFQYSDALVAFAADFKPDLCVLKGVDGGAGVRLLTKYLIPTGTPYVFVIGGKYYTRYVPSAALVFFETEIQRRLLADPGRRFWRSPVDGDKLVLLPKSIDTDRFVPLPAVKKEWDVISVTRLESYYKKYAFDALGKLSERLRVAVVGSGPAEAELRARYPKISWLGKIRNRELAPVLNKGRLFFHAGLREFFPRVLAEAAACGLPRAAFASVISPEVIPADTGLLLDRDDFVEPIIDLISDETRLRDIGLQGRRYALDSLTKYSSREPLLKMLERLGEPLAVSNE